ncbi:MAG: asparaginase domain-containing protein, partial [Methyloceanibacter sp.]
MQTQPMIATANSELPTCAYIATGGTIAMKIDPVSLAPVPALSGEDLLTTVPAAARIAKLEVNNLSNVPSDYMGPKRWVALHHAVTEALASEDIAGVIVS